MADPTRRDLSSPNSREYRSGGRRTVVVLPEANDLDPPPHPAGVHFTDDETEMWADLWATGESTQWTDAALIPVAVLVRTLSRVYEGTNSAADQAEVRHLMEALGLTPAARAKLGWERKA